MKLLHIGRALENEIVIDDASISRRHAQLFIDDIGTAFIIDLNSTNGTFVNGLRIQGKTQITEADILKVGSKIVSWQALVAKAGLPAANEEIAEVDLGDDEGTEKKGLSRQTMIIGGVAATLLIVFSVLFFATDIFGGGGPATAGDLAGKWVEKEDPKAWIQFKEDGSYEEGYDSEVIFTPATWEQQGSDAILIKHDGVTVIYHYELKSSSLTISRTDQEDVYEKS